MLLYVSKVPRPVTEYCSKEVLVMDYLPGPTLVKGVKQQYEALAREQGNPII